ncbi:MAG: hypothetical protein JXL97_11610 [Bacteroidales bacterium]|nr:hypothetical protein [Bacteroidales bacterium]
MKIKLVFVFGFLMLVFLQSSISQRFELKLLPDIINDSGEILKIKFDSYVSEINKPIQSKEQLMNVLTLRDCLLTPLDYYMEDYFYTSFEEDLQTWYDIEEELNSIGFLVVSAEGLYVEMGLAPVIQEEVDKFASEPLKLMLDFKYQYSNALGGEYPFSYLEEYFRAILIAEKLYENYSETEFYKNIEGDFRQSLFITTDIHKVKSSDEGGDCFFSEFSHDSYPFMADCEAIERFVENYPESRFNEMYMNLLGTMSSFTYSSDFEDYIAEAYVVVTDKVADYYEGADLIFGYMLQGKDIVHCIELVNGKNIDYYVVYRYYSEKDLAEIALKQIQKIKPDAYIIHVMIPDGYEPAVIE